MSLLGVRVLGDPILRAETKLVTAVTPEIRQLVADMFDTMYAAKGIGLAAPQVGHSECLAVVDVEHTPMVIINPEVLREEGKAKAEEGCLSIPDIYGDVERATQVTVRAMDLDGNTRDIDAADLRARCLLHEIDHLHGKLFIDYLSVLKRRSALAKWAKEKEKYPGFVKILTPEVVAEHHHRDEEL